MSTKTHKIRYKLDLSSVAACLPTKNDDISILRARANQIAQVKVKEIQEHDVFSYIQFRLGKNEHYGIPYKSTIEVIQNALITLVPSSHNFIAGIINRRGMLINVIDLKILFGMSESDEPINSNIIIVKNNLMQVGFLVDSIKGSDHYSREKLDPPIAADNAIKSNFIMGLHHGSIAIINIDCVLSEIETRLIK